MHCVEKAKAGKGTKECQRYLVSSRGLASGGRQRLVRGRGLALQTTF